MRSKVNVPNVLEYGGYVPATANWTPAEVGKHAPIRIARTGSKLGGKKQWVEKTMKTGHREFYYTARIKIKTEAQAERANRMLTEMYGPQAGHWVMRKMSPRPYMRRAFENIRLNAESILKSKIGE